MYVKSDIGNEINRLEQRLLREEDSEENSKYFEDGYIKLHNNIMTDTILRPIDLNFESNPNFATRLVNALVSQRINKKKTKFYNMKIQIGKIVFTKHPLFDKEDEMVVNLKRYHTDYTYRTYLTFIPFLIQRKEMLEKELRGEKKEKDRIFLKKSLEEATAQLEEERSAIQNMAKLLYDQWVTIKEFRESRGYHSTGVKLVVKEHTIRTDESDNIDYEFGLLHIDPERTKIPSNEKSRRANIEAMEVFAKIYVNEEYVTSTKPVPISFPNFEVDVGEQVQVFVLTMPNSIRLEICLKGFLSSPVIAHIITDVPGNYVKTLTSTSALIKRLEFDQGPYTGFVFFQAEWVGTGPTLPPKILTAMDATIIKKNKSEEEQRLLGEEHAKALFVQKDVLFDINAPENYWKVTLLKELYNKYIQGLLKADMKIPLHEYASSRQEALKRREVIPELSGKTIPLLESELKNDKGFINIWRMFQHEKELKRERKVEKKDEDKGLKRKEKFLETLRKRQQEAKSGGPQKQNLPENVIQEMKIDLQISFILDCCRSIFTPRRRLRPIRKAQVCKKGNTISESKLVIHIIKGHNIPIRNESAPIAKKIQEYEAANLIRPDLSDYPMGRNPRGDMMARSMIRENQDIPKGLSKFVLPPEIIRVETYVEVRLVTSTHTFTSRTQSVEGVHPDWNEIVEIAIKPRKDSVFTDEELSGNTDVLYFILFDEVKKIRDDKESETVKKERRFLGSFTIPLLTVFQNPPRLEAIIKVSRPSIIFGYYTSKSNLFQMSKEDQDNQGIDPAIHTFMNISISLDPGIALPSENEFEYYPGFENIKLLMTGTKWVQGIKSTAIYEKRLIKLFAENVQGESVFMSRYLYPQKPPTVIFNEARQRDSEVSIDNVAHFVAMIPFLADSQAFGDLPDMWCTSQEFIDMCAGDNEEHAVLLCNYFNYIDRAQGRLDYESYVIMGRGIPEGSTSYTMRRNKKTNHVEIWNSVTGECFFFCNEKYSRSFLCIPCSDGERVAEYDSSCALKEIGCIVSADNIYINIQPTVDPSSLFFNLDNLAHWKPFLTETNRNIYFPDGLATVQEKELVYIDTPNDLAKKLEERIQSYVASEFEKLRGTKDINRRPMRTRWKRDISDTFRICLGSLENYKYNIRTGGRNSTLAPMNKAKIKEDEQKILSSVKEVIKYKNIANIK